MATADTMQPVSAHRLGQILDAQKQDEITQQVRQYCADGWRSNTPEDPLLKPYWRGKEQLTLANDLLLYDDRIVVPHRLQVDILNHIQRGQNEGETKSKARQVLDDCWPEMAEKIVEKVVKYMARMTARPDQITTLPLLPGKLLAGGEEEDEQPKEGDQEKGKRKQSNGRNQDKTLPSLKCQQNSREGQTAANTQTNNRNKSYNRGQNRTLPALSSKDKKAKGKPAQDSTTSDSETSKRKVDYGKEYKSLQCLRYQAKILKDKENKERNSDGKSSQDKGGKDKPPPERVWVRDFDGSGRMVDSDKYKKYTLNRPKKFAQRQRPEKKQQAAQPTRLPKIHSQPPSSKGSKSRAR